MSEQKDAKKQPTLIRAYLSPERFRIVENVNGKSDGDLIREAYPEQLKLPPDVDWFVIKSLVEHAVSEKMQAIHNQLFKEIEEILKESWHVTNRFVRDQICKTVQENFEIVKKQPQKTTEKVESKEEKNEKLRKLIFGDQNEVFKL